MIKVTVDGPNAICEGELRGFGIQATTEITMALAFLLVLMERQGAPLEDVCKRIGENLGGCIEHFREYYKEKK